ncbi:TetR/AcrR family transcriptional regulator [Piscinibacter sp. XHJ-5]|uniref:TetR/AcrR family transcriptional regulator n=1 Tax=Piscinibacter sp. XHJ-5 TaxID=3037797 RepID=UPI002452D40E|nr:TetR/AcrR family transcriptional regulator [Piscinibacter sp. XHJ-5]
MKTLSTAKTELVRERVVAGAVAALKAGEVLTFGGVARHSGVPERTIYRHFETREQLFAGVVTWLNRPFDRRTWPQTAEQAREFVARAFAMFNSNESVVRGLLIDPDSRNARFADKAERQRAIIALVRHECPGIRPAAARRVGAVVQLLMSTAAWQGFADYWAMDGVDGAAAAADAIDAVLAGARASTSRQTGRRSTRAAGAQRKE